jgi:hypothetical protein
MDRARAAVYVGHWGKRTAIRSAERDKQESAVTQIVMRGISPKMGVDEAANFLVTQLGLDAALKAAVGERSNARRARCRRRFQFWAKITLKIEDHRQARAHDPDERSPAS